MVGCRTSFIKSASTMITVGQCRLISIHSVLTGTNATTIKVHDTATTGGASAGNEMARIILKPTPDSPSMIEFDMHGVIASNGLYLDISSGSGEGAAVSVEFS